LAALQLSRSLSTSPFVATRRQAQGPCPGPAIGWARGNTLRRHAVTARLDTIDDAELRRRVRSASVFARVVPEQKLRLVAALKENGEIVAMTGVASTTPPPWSLRTSASRWAGGEATWRAKRPAEDDRSLRGA